MIPAPLARAARRVGPPVDFDLEAAVSADADFIADGELARKLARARVEALDPWNG